MRLMKLKDELFSTLKSMIGSAKIILETYEGFMQFMKQNISSLPKSHLVYF